MKAPCTDVYGKRWVFCALGLLALALPHIGYAAEAGQFQFVAGDIKVVSASGVERVPVKGEAFNSGETIVTGVSGSAQIRMSDGGLVAVRPDTQMKLDQYVFNGREDGSERKLVSLIKGGFRAITGLIGNRNRENYKILTPSATIGIRGTDHEAVVIPPGAKGGFQAGTYDRVYRGATIIETERGNLIVNPNQVGFTPGKGVAPTLLPKIPAFFDANAQLPNATNDRQKDDTEADQGGPTKVDATQNDSSVPLGTGLTEKVDSNSKDATPLRNPLETTTAKGQASIKDRMESLAIPPAEVPMQGDLSHTATKSMQKAEDASNLKAPAAKGKPREATSQIAVPAPITITTRPQPVSSDATTVPVATNPKPKAARKP